MTHSSLSEVIPREIPPPLGAVRRVVAMALEEDIGRGDITTEACVPRGTRGEALLRPRDHVVLAGVDVVREVYHQVDPDVEVHERAKDGDVLEAGATIACLVGRASSILGGERVALNFAQRLSGIATLTRRFIDRIPEGTDLRITDTRKTTPGLRALERYAIRCGGGHNHREDLSSAVLIKDNHIAAAGGIRSAIERARNHAPHTTRIECEVDSLEQIGLALEAGADVLLLDNFADADVEKAVAFIDGRAVVEVSGRVTLDRVSTLASLGVDIVSVGALTHSAPAADIGLDWT